MKNKIILNIICALVWLIDKTVRKKFLNGKPYEPTPAVYPFWHGTAIQMIMNNQNSGIVIMASLSKDGNIISSVLKSFGFETVRGSSSRGAQKALKEMIDAAKNGKTLAYAADGPKGAYHILKPGVIYTAQRSSLPILPVAACPKNKIVLKKSWDKMQIPFPFTKSVQIYSKPVYVKDGDDIEQKRLEVENELNRLYKFSDEIYWKDDIKKYLELHPFPKILIVQPSRLGDIVFSLPVVTALKKKYPHSKISWLVDERCSDVLQGHPDIDELIIWNRKRRSPAYYFNLRRRLKSETFDLSIDLHGLFKSAVFVKFADARYKIASSSTNGMREFSWLFSKEIKTPQNLHCVKRHFAVAKELGADFNIESKIYISDEDKLSLEEILNREGLNPSKPIFAFHIGGGWLSRRWPLENFAELIDKINANLDANVALVGGKEGGKSEKGLNEDLKDIVKTKFIDLTNKLTLKQLCALFLKTKVFVANDSGPMHIASAALNTPTIGLLGPTNAKKTRPYGSNAVTIQHDISCRPKNFPCVRRACANPKCMKAISVDEVYEEVLKRMKNNK
jgi:lipopolysaccharide heptosyltransferase II